MNTFRLLVYAGLAISGLVRADGPFVGKWKLNASRSQIVDQMNVEKAGANKYRFNFAGTGSETIALDGTDQAGLSGTTLAVTISDPRTWTVVRKKDGRISLRATWKLSEDGRTLRDTFTTFQADGSTSTADYIYERRAGTSGFSGTWESTSPQLIPVYELQIQPFDGDGLSLVNSSAGTTKNLTLDGKDHPNPGVAQGYSTAGHRVNDHAVDLTDEMNGQPFDTQELRVSKDGKSLTITIRQAGRSKPLVLVFDRQ